MRRVSVLVLILAMSVSANAGPKRTLTAIPRAWGRTVKNMVTFHDKQAAVEEWLQFAAVGVDAWSTNRILAGCAHCWETNIFMGKRPPAYRIGITMGIFALNEASMTQYSHELMDTDPSAKWRFFRVTPTATSAFLHGIAAAHNFGIKLDCDRYGLSCR